MYVNLPHDFKGTHMSRFVEILHHEREISVDSFRRCWSEMTSRLDADAGHIEMTFPFFVMKRAPVTGVESLMDYQASLIGEICARRGPHLDQGRGPGHQPVPVLEEDLRSRRAQPALAHHHQGAPAGAHLDRGADRAGGEEASCELYGILKRPDEKYVTERAYDNPKFVEDMVRDVAMRLNARSASRPMWWRARISNRSTTIRPMR
jgi:GTP cyclohydrolase I